MKIIALFNNKGGVGKTTLAYHLACMMPMIDCPAIAVDLDPQANLTAAFFPEEKLESIWDDKGQRQTVYHCIEPIQEGTGDIQIPEPIEVADRLHIICGDLRLSLFEDKLSDAWPRCYEGDKSALRATTAFYRMICQCAEKIEAQIAIVDVGPNLGAINRAALLAADYLIFPLGADMFSLQGLRNLGPTIIRWRDNWNTIRGKYPCPPVPIPEGIMKPLGYVILQHAMRLDRPVKAYDRWLARIPEEYCYSVLREEPIDKIPHTDINCLATLRHYRSLMPMAQEANKPVFELKPADGAFGGHVKLVEEARSEFESLAKSIIRTISQRLGGNV